MEKTTVKHRLTRQREVILSTVKSACYHPTAHQIYQLTKKLLPSISQGTVYRNLELLTSQNHLRRIDIPGEPARFDADTSPKAYFVCTEKGSIYDLPVDEEALRKLIAADKLVGTSDNFNLVVFGKTNPGSDELGRRKGQLSNTTT